MLKSYCEIEGKSLFLIPLKSEKLKPAQHSFCAMKRNGGGGGEEGQG